jgi:hypothetical protein
MIIAGMLPLGVTKRRGYRGSRLIHAARTTFDPCPPKVNSCAPGFAVFPISNLKDAA